MTSANGSDPFLSPETRVRIPVAVLRRPPEAGGFALVLDQELYHQVTTFRGGRSGPLHFTRDSPWAGESVIALALIVWFRTSSAGGVRRCSHE
jgi:hypothetical protein